MAKYKFQFETGHLYDGGADLEVKDFVAEVEDDQIAFFTSIIEAHGGQLVPEKSKAKSRAKKKVNPVKWTAEAGER
jgi:hypothetical protein